MKSQTLQTFLGYCWAVTLQKQKYDIKECQQRQNIHIEHKQEKKSWAQKRPKNTEKKS